MHREARAELLAAVDWYEAQREGVGRRFFAAVRSARLRIGKMPLSAPLWPGSDPDLGVRRYVVRQWPFAIAYLTKANEVFIIAVANTRRRPGYWLDRIE